MNCPNCNKDISSESKFCPWCGKEVTSPPPDKKWIKPTKCKKCGADVPAGERICPSCGQKKNIVPGCIILIILVFLLGAMINSCSHSSSPSAKKPASTTQESKPQQPKIVTDIQNASHITAEQAQGVVEVLNKCGITEIKDMSAAETLDNAEQAGEKAYRLTSQNSAKNIILNIAPNGSVYTVRYAGRYLYQNGNALATINDFILSSGEQANLTVFSKRLVEKTLKAPKSADFPWPDEWHWSKTPDEIVVQSYVDAQNSFGAQIRAQFEIIYDTKTQNVKSFIFEGKKLI